MTPRSEGAPKGGGGFPDTLREANEAHEARESREPRAAENDDAAVEREERSERADSPEREDDPKASEKSDATEESTTEAEATTEATTGDATGSAWGEAWGPILPLVSTVNSQNVTTVDAIDSATTAATTPLAAAAIDPQAVGPETETLTDGMSAAGKRAPIPGNEGVVDTVGQGPATRDHNPAVPAGAPVAEGETVQSLSRGTVLNQTGPAQELAAKSGPATVDSSWFQKASSEVGTGEGRADFHLLDRNAAPNAVNPVEAANPNAPAPAKAESAPSLTFRVDGGAETTANPVSGTSPGQGDAVRAAGTPRAAEVIITEAQNPTALAKKVFRQVRSSIGRGEHELTLRLDPPRLGRIEVDMAVDSERVGLRFVVETEEVRDALRNSLDELQRALEEQGLRTDHVDVDLRQPGGEQEFSSFGARTGGSASGTETPDEKPAEDRELRLWHLGKTVDLKG